MWVQASLNQRQRLQQLFFPDGIAFDGKQFVRTGVTASAFKYLTAAESSQNNLASPPGFVPARAMRTRRAACLRRGAGRQRLSAAKELNVPNASQLEPNRLLA